MKVAKDLVAASATPMVLGILAEGESYGYAILRRISDLSDGRLDWTDPDDGLFSFITDLVRYAGTYLYGRRLYETMAVWETDPALAAQSELTSAFANVWQAANKSGRWSPPT